MQVSPNMHRGYDLRQLVNSIIGTGGLSSIATVTPDGEPYIHTAYYAKTKLGRLIFASNVTAHHSQNLNINPRCAIAICPQGQKWDDWKRGIQGFGRVTELDGAKREKGWRTYGKEYPEYEEWLKEAGDDAEHMKPALYEIELAEIRILSESELGEENVVTVQVV